MKHNLTATDQKILSFSIRTMQEEDYPAVLDIYKDGVASMEATFETDTSIVCWNDIHLDHSRFVLQTEEGEIIGWCALLKVSDKPYYRGIAETSIYLHPKYQGKGLGAILLEKLILDSEEKGIWTLQAQVFLENTKSLKLHQKLGFHLVGKREKLGVVNGVWKDVWLLERKSHKK